eukprot:1159508-Pelagomonas_calceolata.AAC.4
MASNRITNPNNHVLATTMFVLTRTTQTLEGLNQLRCPAIVILRLQSTRKGKEYIAVPAYVGSFAEAKTVKERKKRKKDLCLPFDRVH